MPVSEYNELLGLLSSLDQKDEIEKLNDDKRLLLLKNIKSYLLRLSNEQINRIFSDNANINNLFQFLVQFNVNDDTSELLFLNESIDIIDKVLSTFSNLNKLFETLNKEFLFIFTQTGDAYDKIQILCLHTFYTLANRLRMSKFTFYHLRPLFHNHVS